MPALIIKVAICLVCISLSVSTAQQAYKWVDEHGQVHYGDKPADGDSQEINIDSPATTAPVPGSREQYRRRVLQVMSEERLRKKQQRQEAEQKRAEAAKKCADARRELQEIQRAGYLYRTNKQGEREIFTDAERAQAIANVEAAVSKYCN